ncbi:MAG: hypothetical protein KA004_19495 [Verrucomicrobiales bacterium]|nr:hypothetical protein [Verrucomicrobiales bacterium]
MRCPFCQNLSREDAAECLHCGFSLPKLDQFFGVPPVLSQGVADPSGAMPTAEKRRTLAGVEQFQARFPQCRFTVFLTSVKKETPLHLYSFWLFNRASLCASLATGAANHQILLVIDTAERRTSIMIGYGLEPFVGAHHLNAALDAARDELAAGNWGAASRVVLQRVGQALESIHAALSRTYGAELQQLGIKPAAKSPVVLGPGEPAY